MTIHDCELAGCEGAARRVHEERLAQGLAHVITDPGALDRAATVVRAAVRSAKSVKGSAA